MANRIRTIDFLPEIFRTETNKQFLGSTLDQLVQEPKLKPTQGYIGRRIGPGVNPNDSYVIEPTDQRTNYQLEPGLVFLEENTNSVTDILTYPGYIDKLRLNGGNVERHDRLFNSEFYSWDPFIDFDKFVNFSQYYWLPNGPDSVDISSTDVPLTDDFEVTRGTNGYSFSDIVGTLPTLTLVREGNYTFELQQTGNPFWIQTTPGADGTLPQNSQSSRTVLGVDNNGEDNGTVTFNVPAKDAQNFYYELDSTDNVDLVTDLKFNQINNIYVDSFLAEHGGIDGINDLDGRTLIFINEISGEDGGWVKTTQFDSALSGFDQTTFDKTEILVDNEVKYSVWRIKFVYDDNESNPFIRLNSVRPVDKLNKFLINYGTQFSDTFFYKASEGLFEQVPLLTASLDILYYQDANNPDFFGVIKLVDQSGNQVLDINEILESSTYTSPNGVAFTNGLKVQFEGLTDPSSYSGKEYYVEGVGTQIKLLPVAEFITPESYTESSTVPYDSVGYDVGGWDDTLNAPLVQDYMTINRASSDRNAWSRSNRWFHIDIINATADYNNTTPLLDNSQRAKRPILEFKDGLKLFNYGTQAIPAVDIIDFETVDAFSNVNGTIGYGTDGYTFVEGTRVIFAADTDSAVRSKVYTVSFVKFDDSSDLVINLQPADITSADVVANDSVLSASGVNSQGQTYRYNGSIWVKAQEKTKVNQAPLFDIFDANGVSFGDTSVYNSSDFKGTKLFSYAIGSGPEDQILLQPLKYLTINNVGDIVFENNINTDSFDFVQSNASTTKKISSGYARLYSDRTTFSEALGWQKASTESVSRQSFSFEYDGTNLKLDVKVSEDQSSIPVKLFIDGVFSLSSAYTYFTNSKGFTEIEFVTAPAIGTLIEVTVISDTVSQLGYYTLPSNLENNAINTVTNEVTLGTIRNHYGTICQNNDKFTGFINGSNNLRDLGEVVPYGRAILQQSSPLTVLGTFLNDVRFDYFKSNEFASAEYEKFKNLILDEVAKNDWGNQAASSILDEVLKNINIGKNENSPFYYSDTLPVGETFEETVYNITSISSNVFDTLYFYDFTKANRQGLLVYLNDEILVGDGHEYTVATDGPRVTISATLNNGDVVKIREYTTTVGNYVPPTPASLGLALPYIPEKYTDNTYRTPVQMLTGHDGSRTVAFNDIRDDVILEFEKRVYNNIKVKDRYSLPLQPESVIPGQSRTTEYSLAEINEILAESFLKWVGQNKLPYSSQTYDVNNKFTWNYSQSKNKLDGSLLAGNWRSIYQYLYDTDRPHTHPWEMLGISEKPTWWENLYGPAPYTSGNLVLWKDLRDGKIANPDNTTTVSMFARPRLLEIIPTDSEGNLKAPFDVVVGEYDSNSFRKSWVFGDGGPVETAWRKSSSYQFALQRLLALTVPAKYFSLFADRDRYRYNNTFNQFLLDDRYRINPDELEIYGSTVSKNSYINWIVDYNRILGLDSTDLLQTRMQNLDIRLSYRMAGFSDKTYLKIFSEKSSPNSLNSSLLLPDESYQLLLYKNPTFSELTYSSVMVQKTDDGYSIFGYSTVNPYFTVFPSIPNGSFSTISVGDDTYRVPQDFRPTVTRIPYGYTFTAASSVVDFLISYGNYLQSQGMTFDSVENNTILNWKQMAEEFVYWDQSNWAVGSMINLNPSANLIKITKENAVAESLISPETNNFILNQNKKPIDKDNYVVERIDNDLTLRGFNNNTFNLVNVKFTAYEHIVVLDNTSIFNDLIYNPGTGDRQGRLLVNGYTTFDWNGTLDAQGFILNQDNVQSWQANRPYSKGEIVLYKNSYWSASEIIPPSETFDFNFWIKSDYDKISKGLLPNLATKADTIRNHYDTKTANLERDADLLGFGLIGFRPRQYMQNLNLDDISQVNLYKQFLSTKGTLQSSEIFSLANLNKEVAEYEITENWAIQRATYGANANRSYFEIKLDEEKLFSNPGVVSIVTPEQTSTADQTILLESIWKQSYKILDTNILPEFTTGQPDTVLPSAGYVNWDEVDIKVFDINDLSAIVNELDEVKVDSNVWVAKNNPYDWSVYRVDNISAIINQVTDNLNGTCTVEFNKQHGLSSNENLIIKNFDSAIDGAYKIVSVPGTKSVIIELSLPGNTATITETGIAFILEKVRVAQASDIVNLSFANRLRAGSKVWVDDDGTGKWANYQKTNPFTGVASLEPSADDIGSLYGTSLAQGLKGQGALVGSPGYNGGKGGVLTYNKSSPTRYVETSLLTLSTVGLVGFGTSLDASSERYAVTGAPESISSRGLAFVIERDPGNGVYKTTQCLVETTTDSNSEFGFDVAISDDNRWMYISAPGEDTVYAYTKVNVQEQVKNFVGDGATTEFDISDTIVVDDDSSAAGIGSQQITVLVNNLPKEVGETWTYTAGEVVFFAAPNSGDKIRIARKQTKLYITESSTTTFSTEDLYTANNIYSFSVIANGALQKPYIDYTFNSGAKSIEFTSGVTGDVSITSDTYWKLVDSFTYASITNESSTLPRFGHSLSTTTDGRQVIVGVPHDDPDAKDFAGSVQIIDRGVERFQLTNTTTRTFSVKQTPQAPVAVKLNNRFLIRDDGFVNNGEYTVVGSAVTIKSTVTLNVGDILEIENNTFSLMQSITSKNNQVLGKFGSTVVQCGTNCSVYIGMPNDSTRKIQSGSVDRWANQARLYGTITSDNTNPTLSAGDSIRINNYHVLVSTPATWTSAIAWNSGSFVTEAGKIYVSLQSAPAGTTIGDTSYWKESSWAELYANDITTADIPNVQVSVVDQKLKLSLVDANAADLFIKLQVLPGIGNAWSSLGFAPMSYAQTILPPVDIAYGKFGAKIDVDVKADTLIVGAPESAATDETTFDNQTTVFDGKTTEYIDTLERTGVVYTYDFLPSANSSAANPGKFVYGQQIINDNIRIVNGQMVAEQDLFGNAVSYKDGILLVGIPQDDLNDSVGDNGRVSQLNNIDKKLAWQKIYQQQSVVDVQLINSIFAYNKNKNAITQYLDFIDPIQGKILGAARQNIDYLTSLDPAEYNNTENNSGQCWKEEHVGEIWWDTSKTRFIDYHQDTLEYKSLRWGQLFPGSTIDIYQWTQSSVPPAEYTGEGEVFNTQTYAVNSKLNPDGLFSVTYYFWVKNKTTVDVNKNKTLSTTAIAQYVENPKSSGISYIAPIGTSSLALYNFDDFVVAQDTILHVEFDKTKNNDNVHVEYDLIADGKADSFLSDGLYRKLLDSFAGADTLGNTVPDVTLSIADKYGVQFRPRQSLFVDRFRALENYLTKANTILKSFPIVESKRFTLLNSEESEPNSLSGEWNKRVSNYAELTYQNLQLVSAGYKYLVDSDETQQGLWTIYTVQPDKSLLLTRVQNYDTKKYWSYTDWVLPGFNSAIKPVAEIDTFSKLQTLTDITEGETVKVTANSFGRFEIYQYVSGEWVRVVAENSTIAIDAQVWSYGLSRFGFDLEVFDTQFFDKNPIIETRQILRALNEEIFIDDLLVYKNDLLNLMFEFILSEQDAPEWLVKTSLVDVNHKIRDLDPFKIFRRDNQDFVQEYINEVKPYHVKVKEFNLRYEGFDTFDGTLTDFDVPSYFDNTYEKFISPVLDDNSYSTVTSELESHVPATNSIWQTLPWSQWYNNFKLGLDSITVIEKGSGYTVPPQVTIVGDATVDAVAVARINTAGELIAVDVITKGEGYITTPTVTITGGNGTGGSVVPVMSNTVVRSFDTTIKFDRYEYTTSVKNWLPNTEYDEGSLIRYQNKVYTVNNVDDSAVHRSGAEFDPAFYTEADQDTLTGIDRIYGLYTPDVTDPGRELALLISGLDYPGVQVKGVPFSQNTGYDIGTFDITVFDNFDIGPEGLPTYSPEILDTIYESSFSDSYLGTRTTDINVAGGKFIDTYSSHAPEELVPGSTFDTLDLKVFTRPGADWTNNGHGFDIKIKNAEYTADGLTVYFGDLVEYPMAVSVDNNTLGQTLDAINNFTVNWPEKRVTITSGATVGDTISIRTFGTGGGDQLFVNEYVGDTIGNSLTVPVKFSEIYDFLVSVNGLPITTFTFAAADEFNTTITFESTYTSADLVSVVAIGLADTGDTQKTWSRPIGEYFVYTGGTPEFTLSNSLQGTNLIDLVVLRNGFRLRPAETIEYTGDGSSAGPYYLPTRGGTNQGQVADNEVYVYIDNVKQRLAVDYTITDWDGSSNRWVEFSTAPDANSQIKIAVTTNAGYRVDGDDNKLTLKQNPVTGSVITVVTYNDTSEQDLLTLVFRGPSTEDVELQQKFDEFGFDSPNLDPAETEFGQFDYTVGDVVFTNNFDVGREILNNQRLEVHKNGERLIPSLDYTSSGSVVTIGGPAIGASDIVTITVFTQNVVPSTLDFRIFQDMLGNQRILRINKYNSSQLTQDLTSTADIIHVLDSSKFDEPSLDNGKFGIVIVNGERISYRSRDVINNTLSGLRRGVGGTAAASHSSESTITNVGAGEVLPSAYQKTIKSNTLTGNGTNRVFVASNVILDTGLDSTEIEEAVRVRVGGTELNDSAYTVTQVNPYAEITLVDAPKDGEEVYIYIVKSAVMYAQGTSTASNGIALQEQTTQAARFIRGEI